MAIHSLDGLRLRAHVSGSDPPSEETDRRDDRALIEACLRIASPVPSARSVYWPLARSRSATSVLIVPFFVLRGLLGELESGVLAFAWDAILGDNE